MTALLTAPRFAGLDLAEGYDPADCCGAMVTEDDSHRCPFCDALRCEDCQEEGWCCDDAAQDHIGSERGEPGYWL